MPDRKLTSKQELFVKEYLIDLNATKAAMRAGYSEKTAYSIGQENLKKPEIAEAIAEAASERNEKCDVSALWVLQEAKELYLVAKNGIDPGDPESKLITAAFKGLDTIGRHVDVQAFKDKLEVDGSPDFLSALANARKRVNNETQPET